MPPINMATLDGTILGHGDRSGHCVGFNPESDSTPGQHAF